MKVVEQLMRVARDPKTSDSSNWTNLPPVLSTLVEITRLSGEDFEKCKADGTIHQRMTCKDVAGRITKQNKPLPPGPTLLDEFKTFIKELKQSMKTGGITVEDVKGFISELTALLP